MPGADRFAAREVGIDDPAEDFARACVERGQRARLGGFLDRSGHFRNMTFRCLMRKRRHRGED